MTMKLLEEHLCFGGKQLVYSHESTVTQCTMKFGIFLPPAGNTQKMPILYWLSGLTCTEQNFINKSGMQRIAAELGLIIVTPDTSPRGVSISGDNDSIELGLGAGFYVDATQLPWSKHYNMASYIQCELYDLINQNFPSDVDSCGIFGHSMGGHGALTLAFKNPKQYYSVSALAPICAPMNCSIGQNAFTAYLGTDQTHWEQYDVCKLIQKQSWGNRDLLIDQGTSDPNIDTWLKTDLLMEACKQSTINLIFRNQIGYDHSYYFIASFIEDHLRYHSHILNTR